MKVMLIAAAAALFAASGASAQDADKEESADEQVQCRYERVTGSRTKAYRICLTKAEWRRRANQEQDELRRYQDVNTGSRAVGGG